jgi:zinc protease
MRTKILLLTLLVLFSNYCLFADDSLKFAHDIYQVKPNPKASFYTLKNGFRYILLPNKTPEKRVLIYLFVNAGSLNEKNDQQGLAHFLEHMAFNGTKNYPGESMIAFFKKIGMDFGGDTNAYTDFGETVYSLNLPEEKLMKDGISIMSDYAMNMLLANDEIEKERGVILSEKRERDDIEYRIQYQEFQFAMPGCLVAERFPIGLEDSIKTFKRDNFVDFYTTWYRPENMVLVVVGDIESKKWSKSISKAFDAFKAKAPKGDSPVLKDVGHKGVKINYYYEKEAANTNIGISTLVIKEPEVETYLEKSKSHLAESAANYILNKRFSEKLTQKNIPIVSGNVNTEVWLKKIVSGSISATCKPENWKLSLALIENELRQALEFGFTDQEFLLFKKEYLNQLDNAVNTMSTIESQDYVGRIINSLSEGLPFLDATQSRDILKPILEKLTKDDALKSFKQYWEFDHRLINVSGNVDIKDAINEIKKVYEDAKGIELNPQRDEAMITFPYEPKPTITGKIVSLEEFKELGFKRIVFTNNVVVNFKKTDLKKNCINFNINFGLGALAEPSNKEGISHLAGIVMNEGGLEKLSKTDLVKSLAGKNVSSYFSVEPNSFIFQAETTPADFELNLQLCRAMLLNPGFREEADEVMKKTIDQMYNSLASNISEYYQNALVSKLTAGERFMSIPDRKVLESFTLNDVKVWLLGQFKDAAIEINIVGDIDEAKIPDLVAVYFGSLETRKKIEPKKIKDLALAKSFDVTEDFHTKISKALVSLMIPTIDFRQIDEVRQLNLLGKILDEKALKLVREKLSISYSPNASHSFDQDYKNFCYLQFSADIEPKNIEATKNAFESIIKEVFEKGITSEDLESVRKPTVNQIKDFIKTNEYWLERVLKDSYGEPENLKFAATFLKSYEQITAQQVNTMIKKYLILDKKSVFVLQAVVDKKESSEPVKKE